MFVGRGPIASGPGWKTKNRDQQRHADRRRLPAAMLMPQHHLLRNPVEGRPPSASAVPVPLPCETARFLPAGRWAGGVLAIFAPFERVVGHGADPEAESRVTARRPPIANPSSASLEADGADQRPGAEGEHGRRPAAANQFAGEGEQGAADQ